ncbi:MAG: sulfatase [Prolixibacteraceae bacterium]
MNNSLFCKLSTGLVLSSVIGFQATGAKPEYKNKKPNLIFIFSDQHSFDMLGCNGNKQIKTPNIDQFAKEAVRFNHCISSCPVCTPYRSMLLSGQHPLKNGAMVNDIQMLPGNGNYLGQVLRDAGYHTGYYGKWHLYGGDRERAIPEGPYRYGFDNEFLSNNCTMLYDSARAYYWSENGEKTLYGDWEWNAQTRQSLDFLDKNAGKEKPVAMFLSWHAPHDWMAGGVREHKYSAPEHLEALYNLNSIILRKNCEDTEKHRKYYQGYMAMVTSLDEDFGLIMKKLEDLGIADNSVIIFTSDHGDLLESHNWPFNKGRPEIESIRVPLIIKFPEQKAARVSELLVGTLDLMPTVLGLLGIKEPKTCDGKNLADAIHRGNDNAVKSVPLFYFAGDWRGVYTHQYTYTFALPGGAAEPHAAKSGFLDNSVLYCHTEDPFELNNLFNNPEYLKQKEKLHQQASKWMKKFNDKGIPSGKLLPRVMYEDDYKITTLPHPQKPKGFETRLKGRPVDYQ